MKPKSHWYLYVRDDNQDGVFLVLAFPNWSLGTRTVVGVLEDDRGKDLERGARSGALGLVRCEDM